MNLKPLHDWLVVKMEPIPEKHRELFLVHGDRVRMGTVLEVGPGRHGTDGGRLRVGVEKGERVAFFRENLEHQQGKQILDAIKDLGDDIGLIRANDVLFVVTPRENIQVSG